jgi:membrane-bound serine protease (ClpP class)
MLATCLLAASLAATAAAPVSAAEPSKVVALTFEGVVNPFSSRYLERGLEEAKKADAVLLVRLDTPGGLERTMRDMVRLLLAAPVPVIVYVSPAGGRAASAGMFIVAGAHVAAMAPGTNIGAAHPVSIGGDKKKADKDDASAKKLVEDVAALARSVGKERGRNAEWLEKAVRESVSITADEALEKKVVDLVAPDAAALLAAVDGREVRLPSGPRVLRTAGAAVRELPMGPFERFFQIMTDPNIAYIFLSLGMLALMVEIYTPGVMVSGAVGAICLLLAFAGLGSLPLNYAAALLILVGLIFFAVEAHAPGFGGFGAVGLAAFLLGSFMFYRPFGPVSPALPRVHVDPRLYVSVAVVFAGLFASIAWAVWKLRARPAPVGMQAMVGEQAVAVSDIDLHGVVEFRGDRWSAESLKPIRNGEKVRITGVRGTYVLVDPAA